MSKVDYAPLPIASKPLVTIDSKRSL